MKRLFQDALLGTKLIWRERQREDFKIFLFSLALAVFCMTILNVLNAAAWDTLYAKAVKAYGGDLCITSSRPIPESVLIKAQMLEFESASVNTLLTMASNQDQFHLVSLKAVGSGYPLQGEVEIKNHENTFFLKHGPPAGTIWVEQGLQSALNIKLNELDFYLL